MRYNEKPFSELLGKTITEITGLESESDSVSFICSDGTAYEMYHEQDCCESVYIEDVCGDVGRLIGTPITMAEEISNSDDPPRGDPKYVDSYTWTYYKLATIKGYATIRWYGESNGHYREAVDFFEILK